MAKNFWKIVNDVIKKSDIVIIIADARVPESVNTEVLKKIEYLQKKYMIIFNKEDLLDADQKQKLIETKKKYEYSLSVSAKNHSKTMSLLRRINALAQGKEAVVGVVGYPNTGKSSIINAIKGRHSASVSSQAGHTKGVQKLRATGKIVLLDTPGVIPYDNKDAAIHGLFAARSPNQLKDPEGAAMKVLEYLEGKAEEFYGVPIQEDYEDTLEMVAEQLNLKKKGDIPDSRRAAVQILLDWQKGKY